MLKVAFVDLTHSEVGIPASNFPLGISYIAAAAIKHFGPDIDFRLLKYPADLSAYLDENTPHIVAFSSYMWNANIQLAYARAIKRRHPEVATVFGGPHFPVNAKEQELWLQQRPEIDFYIDGEGEQAFIAFAEALVAASFDLERVKAERQDLPNLRFFHRGRFVHTGMSERILSLDEAIPSPYLMGLMDPFFDGRLTPMLQTSRGCPYSCTFCHDGLDYMNKTRRFSQERIDAELEYVFDRVNVPNVTLADLNWGMFPGDIDTAKTLARMKELKQWPRIVITATAKNQKQRVIDMAAILKESMVVGASIQSTDAEVLANIKRTNIGYDAIVTMAKQSKTNNSTSFSEIILCLPGDTREKHVKSICDMLDAGIQDINNHQFVPLPGTEAANPEVRAEWQYVTKFRVLPRCFGVYRIYGEDHTVFEYNEICIANRTMPQADYQECRWFDLTVSIFNNGSILSELYQFAAQFGIKRSDLIRVIHELATKPDSPLRKLYEDYRADEERNFWDDEQSLLAFLATPEALEGYRSGKFGTNQVYMYRTLGMATHLEHVIDVMTRAVEDRLVSVIESNPKVHQYIQELREVMLAIRSNPLDIERSFTLDLHFDFATLSRNGFQMNPLELWHAEPQTYVIGHDDVQRRNLEQLFGQFGKNLDGLSHLIHRSTAQVLHRSFLSGGAPAPQPQKATAVAAE
jgi:radical SAM superfamily enzyme YgiQ (UPF0313 family)